MMNRVTWL